MLPYLVLLRVGFTLPPLLPAARCALTAPFHPYLCSGANTEAIGGLFSAALSVGSRPPGVTWHPALWSPDFPPHVLQARHTATVQPTSAHSRRYFGPKMQALKRSMAATTSQHGKTWRTASIEKKYRHDHYTKYEYFLIFENEFCALQFWRWFVALARWGS